MLTWEKARDMMDTPAGKRHGRRRLALNTYLYAVGEDPEKKLYVVRLHKTDILTFHPDGSVVLATGGWRTPTTKNRLNEFGPVDIWQDHGVWYCRGVGSTGERYTFAGNVYVFTENMRVFPSGRVEGAQLHDDEQEKKARALGRRIVRYSRDYAHALSMGKIPKPSLGDCLFCRLNFGAPTDHLPSHMDEKYYVPALLLNAIDERPHALPPIALRAIQEVWEGGSLTEWSAGCLRREVASLLRRYLRLRLGLAC